MYCIVFMNIFVSPLRLLNAVFIKLKFLNHLLPLMLKYLNHLLFLRLKIHKSFDFKVKMHKSIITFDVKLLK